MAQAGRGGHGEAIKHLGKAVTSLQAGETRLSVETPMPLTHFIFCCLPVQKKEKKGKKKKEEKRGGVEWGKAERRKRTVNLQS